LRKCDSTFSAAFDEVFRSEGIRVIRTPVRAPQAHAYAERFVRTVRAECLDWLLILGQRHLEHVLRTYGDHYGWKSSMKKRAHVKVRGCAGLVASPLAAARAVTETLQSSIRPRGAGQSAVRGSGAQSSGRPSRVGEARLSCELARAVRRRDRGRGAG
jgi:transposase InsO family protein